MPYNRNLMFERYTERARRVLFFARYEASQLGSISIETEHLLLGLIREGKGLTSRIFQRSHLSLETIRKEIEGRTVFREKVSTSVEIPFSAETKRVLQFAAEEADRLLHNYIGTEHLLLGILREERSVAATILMEKGMRLNTVREDIVALLNEKTTLTRVKETPLLAEFSRDLTEAALRDMRLILHEAGVEIVSREPWSTEPQTVIAGPNDSLIARVSRGIPACASAVRLRVQPRSGAARTVPIDPWTCAPGLEVRP